MNNKIEFPEDYTSYMNNLRDHEIYSENGYVELFPVSELNQINTEYETEQYVPNFVAVGTNGAGVGIFINKENKQFYSIPFVGMDESDAVLLANSFSEFIYKFENEGLEIY